MSAPVSAGEHTGSPLQNYGHQSLQKRHIHQHTQMVRGG